MTFPDVPPVGIFLDRYHRYWMNGSGPMPSVTTVTKVIGAEALITWGKKEVARTAVNRFGELHTHLSAHLVPTDDCPICAYAGQAWDTAETSAQRWLASTPDHVRDTAAAFGNKVHAHAEALSYGAPLDITEDEQPFVEAFQRWREDYKPHDVEAEFMVVSLRHRYAGTGDYLGVIDGRLTLVDYKSGKYVPEDVDLQLSGYRWADGIARANVPDLEPMGRIERTAVLHLRPDKYPDKGYAFTYRPVTPATFDRFLDARRLWSWKKEQEARWRQSQKEAA